MFTGYQEIKKILNFPVLFLFVESDVTYSWFSNRAPFTYRFIKFMEHFQSPNRRLIFCSVAHRNVCTDSHIIYLIPAYSFREKLLESGTLCSEQTKYGLHLSIKHLTFLRDFSSPKLFIRLSHWVGFFLVQQWFKFVRFQLEIKDS